MVLTGAPLGTCWSDGEDNDKGPRFTNDARDLIVQTGETLELSGDCTYTRSVQINGTLTVKPYDGVDASTGSLTLRAPWLIVGPGGKIAADGRGFGGGGAGTSYSSTGKPGGMGGGGGKGGAGAASAYTSGGGGGGGSNGGTGGSSSYGAGAYGTAIGGGNGGATGSYKGGVGGSGFGGGGGGGASGSSYGGGGGGGGGSGGNNAAEKVGGSGVGPAGGAGGQTYSSYYNAILNGQNGGYKVAGGNGDTSSDLSVVKGSGGGGGGASCQYTGGGGGGGAGGGAVMLISSGNIAVDGAISTTGGGGGAGGYYSTSTSYPGGQGGGGAGGGILLSGLKVTVTGSLDARGRTANSLSLANGGTVKILYDIDQSSSASIQAGRIYKNGRPKMAGLVSPENGGAALIRTVFSWNAARDPESEPVTYHIQVSRTSDFSSMEQDVSGIHETGYASDKDLIGAFFYWRVRAADAGGYGSWSPVWKFFTDTLPPVSRVAQLSRFTNTANFTVSWSGTDDSSGVDSFDIFLSEDGGAFIPWQSKIAATSAVFHGTDGHRYCFFSTAVDKASNQEEQHNGADTCTTVDTTPPVSRFVSLAPYQSKTEFQLTWAGKDSTSGIKSYDVCLATGDSPFEVWLREVTRSSASFEGTEGQEYSFYTIATDNAGNVETVPGQDGILRVKIDQSAPSTQVRVGAPSYGQDPVFVSAATPMFLDGSDGFTGVKDTFYRIDERAQLTYTTGIRETVAGSHNMTFWSTDKAGNMEDSGSFWFWVDGDAPDTSIIFDGLAFQRASTAFVTAQTSILLVAQDACSGVSRMEYKLDGSSYKNYDMPITVGSTGTHTLLYRSVDRVGNVEAERKLQITVDTASPTTRAVAPSGSSSVTLTVSLSASDEGSGVGGTFFRIVAQGARPGDFQQGTQAEVEASEDHSLDGNYTIQYYSIDNVNNAERVKEYKVRIDTSVSIQLENPLVQSVSGMRYVVEGKTEPGSTVTVNDKRVAVSADGSFFEEVELQPGKNDIVLTITDVAGNTITKKIKVTYSEPLAQASWFLPLLAVVALACAIGVAILWHRRKRRLAALEMLPPEV